MEKEESTENNVVNSPDVKEDTPVVQKETSEEFSGGKESVSEKGSDSDAKDDTPVVQKETRDEPPEEKNYVSYKGSNPDVKDDKPVLQKEAQNRDVKGETPVPQEEAQNPDVKDDTPVLQKEAQEESQEEKKYSKDKGPDPDVKNDTPVVQKEAQEELQEENNYVRDKDSSSDVKDDTPVIQKEAREEKDYVRDKGSNSDVKDNVSNSDEKDDAPVVQKETQEESAEGNEFWSEKASDSNMKEDTPVQKETREKSLEGKNSISGKGSDPDVKDSTSVFQKESQDESPGEKYCARVKSSHSDKEEELHNFKDDVELARSRELESESVEETNHEPKSLEETATQTHEEVLGEEEEKDPVFDGTEVPGMEANRSTSIRSSDGAETQASVWPEKAAAVKNYVKDKSVVAVSTVIRRLSGKTDDDDGQNVSKDDGSNGNDASGVKDAATTVKETEAKDASPKTAGFTWNLLSFISFSRDVDAENKTGHGEDVIEGVILPLAMKGRIMLYTRLGCQDCKAARLFLHWKRLRYVEINIDVYPSRKLELEKISGCSAVPKIFFNEILIGGFSELKALDDSGKLDEKINDLITQVPSTEAPLPPLSGEDDVSDSGAVDELAVVAQKMKGSIVVKDRFYKIRRFSSCFVGSEAVDFLSQDQHLEREQAIEYGRKLASKLFFAHVLNENIFEDGSHLYRFLDDDPIVSSQCHNIPRGIIHVKPKSIVEIASRLRFISYAIYEAYTSEDGRHVDYRSIHGSEEFARYLRTVEELQRVDLEDMSREEKLAFFINLYNMMAIHAILVLGYPVGALDRRRLFGDFKYVVGGCTYSISAIHNGILRANQRPPYNLIKPFGIKDKRLKVALLYPEPLVHFALICGNRSGPALRCYSPGDIDKELVEAARNFLRSGGLIVDFNAKTASVSKIFKWYSVDFGKNETEVLRHAANYMETAESEAFLELLASAQLKVTYQPYDWGLNC